VARRPEPVGPVPAETACAVRAAFIQGHRLRRLRDALGTIYDNARVVPLFPAQGRNQG